MTAMVTPLEEYSDERNYRLWSLSGHTVGKPKLVAQKRKVANSATGVAEDVITILYGTEDAAGDLVASRVLISIGIKRPVNGIAADLDAAMVVARDIMQSTEMDDVVDGQTYLK